MATPANSSGSWASVRRLIYTIEAMIEQQDSRISELKQRSRSLDQRITKLKLAQSEIIRREVPTLRKIRER